MHDEIIFVWLLEREDSHPITLSKPEAEPPVAEGCGSNHQDNVQDSEKDENVACTKELQHNY